MKTIFLSSTVKSLFFGMIAMTLFSCGTKKNFFKLPDVPVTYNYYDYTIQNMDEIGKCDANSLTAYYEGFNVIYSVNESKMMTLTIENKTNKSLIIDKAKSYVLYDGVAQELFKDVRTGKITTYNNVQDAINNVQTNESSVTFSIPPYSKWKLPVNETNLSMVSLPHNFYTEIGDYSFTPFTTNATIEFILPYTFDYALANWGTSRNRLYIGNIHVEKIYLTFNGLKQSSYSYDGIVNQRLFHAQASSDDFAEYNRIVGENNKIQEHNLNVQASRDGWSAAGNALLGVLSLSAGVILALLAAGVF